MEDARLLSLLEETAARVGLTVRYERLEGANVAVRDGYCRVKGADTVFVEKRRPLPEKIRILAEILSSADIEDAYMPPVVRELLEQVKSEQEWVS